LRAAKRLGFSDGQLAYLLSSDEASVRRRRLELGVAATMKTVDTLRSRVRAYTPYHYATYEDTGEVEPSGRERVVILGSGPNRIGQGIEFDYCCVHASMALRAAGYETIMVNCNPETVSTDYDTSDRLYFEPLTVEDVTNVLDAEIAASVGEGRLKGVIVALGGPDTAETGARHRPSLVLGTSPEAIDLAEDREQWNALCERLGVAPAPRRHRQHGRRGTRGGPQGRLPGAGAPELCARRARHGDRLRRRGAGARDARSDRRGGPGAARSLARAVSAPRGPSSSTAS